MIAVCVPKSITGACGAETALPSFLEVKLSEKLFAGIQPFLDSLPAGSVKRGQKIFDRGSVIDLKCVDPGQFYVAIVRDSGDEEDVDIEFMRSHWVAECSCLQERDCKHIAAAMLELRERAELDLNPERAGAHRRKTKANEVPQPPASPLYDKLTEHLGRKLKAAEAAWLGKVQALYGQCQSRPMTEIDLRQIASAPVSYTSYDGWKQVDLWPEVPRDDYLFWQYIAWALRQRKLAVPAFLDGFTNFGLIENDIRRWERQKEIIHWKSWLQDYSGRAPLSEPGVLDLRLAVFAEEARLQWRMEANAQFADLKQAQAKKLAEQFSEGELAIAPESLPLWSAAYKPWHYDSWWSFKYDNATARPALNRLFRLPLGSDRVVSADGQPLARPAEPLRLNLHPPQDADGDYELALTMADGSAPPPVLCVLAGQPTLYLAERSVFQGPPGEALDKALTRSIPSGALETSDGARFLHLSGVPFPERIQSRVQTVPVTVQISCSLNKAYAGSSNEDIVVAVIAKAREMPEEKFTLEGWSSASHFGTQKKSKPETSDIIIHDRGAQKHFPRVLEPLGLKWGGYPSDWRLRMGKKTPELFVAWLKSIPPEIEVHLDRELATLRDEPISGDISLDVAEVGIDWFDLKVVLNAGDTTLTPEELKLLLNARGGYVRLGAKGWRRLQFNLTPEEDEHLARLGLNAADFSAEPQRFHVLQLADNAAKRFLGPDRVENLQRRVSELKTRVSPPVPVSIRAEMRPYQTQGFHFLAYLTSNRFGGVLADDMGLGKTLQTLAWLAWLRENAAANGSAGSTGSAPRPSMVVCPKSVMDNWRTEAERFYPDLRVRLWRGEPAAELSAARETADLIVLNYPQLRSLWPPIASMQWFAAILDEAQYIKNPDSQTAQAARALNAEHRLALTGTPIENRLLDLWSILGFAMPGVLGNRTHFLRRFDAKDDPLARRRLSARVRPFLLRRTKSQVATDLPDRIEEDLLCEMEGEQQTLYRAELKRARQMLLGLKTDQELNKERFNMLTSLLRLRQICCHPALVDAKLRGASSAKVSALEDLLEPLIEEGHKVLVFSQFVTMLDLLREKMKEHHWPFFYLAGDTENRGELVQRFQSAKDGGVFLISLKAGGFGLNLTAASYVVLFDPWWNPAVENQAIDRTHRIGQTSKVIAYRLLMRDSLEQKMRALQKVKAALADDVLGEERFSQSLTLDDFQFLFAD